MRSDFWQLSRLGLLAVACVGLTLAAACTSESPHAAADPLPDVTLAPLFEGDAAITTSDIDGPTVINFWASWCEFCIDEMPDFERVATALDGQVRIIGVDRMDPLAAARELATQTGVTYPLVVDEDDALFRELGLIAMPTTLFVDARGVIGRHQGPLDEDALRTKIDEYFGSVR